MFELPQVRLKKDRPSIAVLTSGGDAPGMNAAIRSVVRSGIALGCRMYGIQSGYSGLLEGAIQPLTESSVANIIQRGGTLLKTSRCKDFYKKSARKRAAEILKENHVDALIVIGGDGSFSGAHLLSRENKIPVVGIPGTIDNDIWGTDDTIGFDTAVNTAIEAIDRIRDTASSHDRLFLVEVMGRDSGFIALQVGIGGGAETIVVPEFPLSVKEITDTIERGIRRGKKSSIIVLAEGEYAGEACPRLAKALEAKGYSSKSCILGHIQRGGTPTAHDRLLASAMGHSAVQFLLAGKTNGMVGIQENRVVFVPFKELFGKKKRIDSKLMELSQRLAI